MIPSQMSGYPREFLRRFYAQSNEEMENERKKKKHGLGRRKCFTRFLLGRATCTINESTNVVVVSNRVVYVPHAPPPGNLLVDGWPVVVVLLDCGVRVGLCEQCHYVWSYFGCNFI